MNAAGLGLRVLCTAFLACLPVAVFLCDRLIPSDRIKMYRRATYSLVFLWYAMSMAVIGLVWFDAYLLDRARSEVLALAGARDGTAAENADLEELAQSYLAESEASRTDAEAYRSELEELRTVREAPVRYDYHGFRLERDEQGERRSAGRPCMMFNRMEELSRKEQWQALATLAEDETQRTPEWLTPYLFAGIAHAHLGDMPRARTFLEHVQKFSLGDPQYAVAGSVLRNLGEDGTPTLPDFQVRLQG